MNMLEDDSNGNPEEENQSESDEIVKIPPGVALRDQ